MGEYVGDRFHERQICVAVTRERMKDVWELVQRMATLNFFTKAIVIAEHEWDRAIWRDQAVSHDPSAFIKKLVPGPIAHIDWDLTYPIDRETFTDRWLRNIGLGMAYQSSTGPLSPDQRNNIPPEHFVIHDAVLALFESNCEIRHNHHVDDEGMWDPVTVATFDTCFILRDSKLTGVFVFGEED